MKRINTIIESSTPPHGKHTLWLKSKEDGSKELVYNGDKVGSDNSLFIKWPIPKIEILAITKSPIYIDIRVSDSTELTRTTFNLRETVSFITGNSLNKPELLEATSLAIEQLILYLDKLLDSGYSTSSYWSYVQIPVVLSAYATSTNEYLISKETCSLPASYGWIGSSPTYEITYKGNGDFKINYH